MGYSSASFSILKRPACSRQGPCPPRKQHQCFLSATQKPRLSYMGKHQPYMSHAWSSDGASAASQLGAEVRLRSPIITKSDDEFQSEYVEFVWGMDELNLEELNDLFKKVKFPDRDIKKLKVALEKTFAIVWVRSTRNSRWAREGQLLGFARAFSDKSLTATIWDVAVHPAWQRGGLGRALMERLTACLVQSNIQTICLYAEPNVVTLYEKLGYVMDPYGVKGMAFRAESKMGRAVLAAA